jgi:predicted RNase H-like HicB family nuclease
MEYHQRMVAVDGYPVIVEWLNDNYGASSPEFDGCVASGSSFEEVVENMHEVLALHIEGMQEDGIAVPPPHPELLAQLPSFDRDLVG